MMRHEWRFDFRSVDVAAAAAKRADYHHGRAAYWKSQLSVAEAHLHEQDAEGDSAFDPVNSSVSNSYGSIRDKAQARVTDVRGKMREHGNKVREYRLWQELLGSGGQEWLALNRDDVEYFDLLAVVGDDPSAV